MKKIITGSALFFVLAMAAVIGFSSKAEAREFVSPSCGYYKIVATNGNGNGQELYYDKDARDKDLKWKNEGTIWLVSEGPYSNSYCIRWAENPYFYINVDDVKNNATVKMSYNDGPYATHHVIYFCKTDGGDTYNNVRIVIYNEYGFDYSYQLNRHKSIGYDYVNLRDDADYNNKLWKLVPVNYSKSFSKSELVSKVNKKNKLFVKWDKLRNKYKDTDIWKNAEKIEIQYSTDKEFEKKVKKKIIKKGTVDKKKAISKLSKLKIKKTWYIRARLIDADGVYTNWSKVKKIKPNK